ncbi:MAG: alpha-hydroxy-acid oxidizing protein [Brevinemataceae bacterium]
MANKLFLIIGAGELQIPLIQAAQKLGFSTVVTDINPSASGFELADYRIIADTLNAQETLQKIKEFIQLNNTISGVATAGTDASYTVAVIADALNLPGHSPKSAWNASNKAIMRQTLQEHNISIPKFKIVQNYNEAFQFFKEIGSFCVTKPITNMGARGISLIKNESELSEACSLVHQFNRNENKFLIEEYIDAHELSIDALIEHGNITITGIADRIIEYTPYFVETGHILPSQLPESWIERAVNAFSEAIKALGLTHGAAKADLKISNQNTWIIEIAARLSGGFMSSHTFPAATGIPLHEYMVKLAIGEKLPDIVPIRNFVSVERAIIVPPGIVTNISIPNNLLEFPYISHVSIRAQEGDHIYEPKNNTEKSGNIIACSPSLKESLKAVNHAIRHIKITTKSEEDFSQILSQSNSNAKILLKNVCNVCIACDGVWCRGKIPGVGGKGTGEGFIHAYERMRQIKMIPTYIHERKTADTSINMFGIELSMPILTAPIGGAGINYNNAVSELEFYRAFAKGAWQAGTMSMLPDPAQKEYFELAVQAAKENYGQSIFICKPRNNISSIQERFQTAENVGVIGLGIDIDGIGLKTMLNYGQYTSPKSKSELQQLRNSHSLPFVIKGILSVQDALHAVEAGATHLVVSSHGGRIEESLPLPIDVLPEIRKAVGNNMNILVDGAIRSGSDVVKALILGADAVLIGRPVAIHAVGGGHKSVRTYLKNIRQELELLMILLGVSSIQEIKGNTDLLYRYHS